ncbi:MULTISPECIES: hypothetical protein [Enterococcus]|nr:hypothetical protein [Enterococcus faecalis]MDK4342642.1 hypothetical protein [Enterococcus faecalis]MDK4419054.1 hypothetical protein [Enterococcus faecalis]MDK4456390.1 hypothetical protein [Enterococcus faecalis]MDN3087587.1 hypothetical protein [Enterococcus faecalis]MDS4065344.1 hypothetical protein [Enterococcus faecalis]
MLEYFGLLKISNITPLYCQKRLNSWAESLPIYKHLRIYVNMVFKYRF